MEIKSLDHFRLIDRNKASATVEAEIDGQNYVAEWVFYLQSDYCVSIRVGKVLKGDLKQNELEEHVFENRVKIKALVKPEVVRVRAERRALNGLE